MATTSLELTGTAGKRGWRELARRRAQRAMEEAALWLDASAWRGVIVLLAAYLPLALLMAHAQQLSADEVYTLRIAQQPTIRQMVQLSREIDLHPPLHFLLEREALKLELPRWLGARLPSLVAGVVGLLAVFAWMRRYYGNLAGVLAGALYLFTPATDYAWSNRPYGLWLALLAVCLLAWDASGEEPRRWWWPVLLAVAAAAMVLDYMFGLACLGPLLVAEAVRCYRRGRVDWAVPAALLPAALLGLTYVEQVRSFATNSFSPQYLPSWGMAGAVMADLLLLPVAALAACMLTSMLFEEENEPWWYRMKRALRAEQTVLLSTLALLPLGLLAAAAVHRTQFFERYAACGAVGVSLLLAGAIFRYCKRPRAVATLMVGAVVIGGAVRAAQDPVNLVMPWRGAEAMGLAPRPLASLDPSQPIVVAAAIDFTELNDREPLEVARRLVYLTDRAAAQQFSGETIFETEDRTVALLGLPGRAVPMHRFLEGHARFYVVGDYLTPQEWVLRYLMAHGAHLQYLGKCMTTTVGDDLYEVTL